LSGRTIGGILSANLSPRVCVYGLFSSLFKFEISLAVAVSTSWNSPWTARS